MLNKVDARSEVPGYWEFTPKGKSDTFLMINLGAGVSVSHAKARKLFEYYSRSREEPTDPLMMVLYEAYHMKEGQ